MAVNPSPWGPKPQMEDTAGEPAVGYRLFAYVAGSTTKQDTFTDSTGAVANTNPLVLNALGQPSTQWWWTDGLSYKIVLAPPGADDPPTSPVWTVDNVNAQAGSGATQSQWVPFGGTPTYINATQFTVAGDQTGIFQEYRRVKCTVTSGTVYGTITSSAYAALTTVTVGFDSTGLDSGLSLVEVGLITPQDSSLMDVQNWPRSIGRNITGQNNASNPNFQFDWNADEFVVKDANGVAKLLELADVTVDITVSGVNGLDTGVEANSTWYYGHIIYNPTTDTKAGVLSLSWTSPTLPAGYTLSAPIGAVYNGSGGHFALLYQRGMWMRYRGVSGGMAALVLSGGAATTETAITVSAFVPPIAEEFSVFGKAYVSSIASVAGNDILYFRTMSGETVVLITVLALVGGGQANDTEFTVANQNQTLIYIWVKTSNGTLSASAYITGFSLPIGGQ